MLDPVASGHPPAETPPADTARFDQRLARLSALVAVTSIFAGVAYSRESGFAAYAVLFAIPYALFMGARSSRKWQARGWALACVIFALALVPAIFTALKIMRRAHHSDKAILVLLLALLLSQAAQLIFVRRAFPGLIAFGKPLFRTALYYICLLLVVAATLPNWYVPRTVRRENQAVDGLRQYSTAMRSYMTTSKDKSYPPDLSALSAEVSSGTLDSELICAHASCIKNGYRFEYRPEFKEKRVASYTISARPLEFEETGRQSFLLNADGNIHQTREDRDALLTDGNR
ncbi:MAG TPA: hypothetical protein VFR08_06855 [Candidatus Angelobacter sp.]|nr:hypothetical protein [Candidatus Angelobacter sp.]